MIVGNDRAIRQVNDHETTTPEVARRGIGHCQSKTSRDRRINGVASVSENLRPNLSRQGRPRRHHSTVINQCFRCNPMGKAEKHAADQQNTAVESVRE